MREHSFGEHRWVLDSDDPKLELKRCLNCYMRSDWPGAKQACTGRGLSKKHLKPYEPKPEVESEEDEVIELPEGMEIIE